MYTQELASNMVVRTFLEGTHGSVTETLFLHTINAQPRTLERSTNTEVLFFLRAGWGWWMAPAQQETGVYICNAILS